MDTKKLLELNKLKENGSITEDEFLMLKKSILEDDAPQTNVKKANSSSTGMIVLSVLGLMFMAIVVGISARENHPDNPAKAQAEDNFNDEGVNADLMDMFTEKKENEYSFNQKYNDRELTFKAKIHGIKSRCYIKNILADNMEYIPCVELAHPTKVLQMFDLVPTAIANAKMKDVSVISTLKRNEKIKLTCTLGNSTLDLVSLVFENCRLYEGKTEASNNYEEEANASDNYEEETEASYNPQDDWE